MSNGWSVVMRPLLRAAGHGKLTILIYHRVHREADPLYLSAADARRFDEQMSWVAAAQRVLPLHEAVAMLRQRRIPPRAACITFDDGYADNVEVALPILQRHHLPATFFIATGFLDGGRMWNDTIIESLRRAPGSDLDLRQLDLGTWSLDSARARRATAEELISRMKYLPAEMRQSRVDALARRIGAELPHDLMMRSDQVRALHLAGMQIGAHTSTHPILAQIDNDAARAEIRDGRAALESIIGAPVTLFAYPNGKPNVDYESVHVAMVRDLGFDAAVSTRRGAANADSDVHQLPRFTPWGKNALRFGASLARNHLERR